MRIGGSWNRLAEMLRRGDDSCNGCRGWDLEELRGDSIL